MLNGFHPWSRTGPMHILSSWNSALLVFQHVQSFLVLGLERHDKMLRGDFPPPFVVHLAHENVVQASPDERALLAEDDDLGAHRLPRLLDHQVAFFINVDDGHGGVHASSSHHRCNDGPTYHSVLVNCHFL